MRKRYVVAAIASPVLVWLGFIVIGKVKPDDAGTAVFTGQGPLLPFKGGLAVESAAAGVLLTWLLTG